MKKQYIKPSLMVVTLADTNTLLAGSINPAKPEIQNWTDNTIDYSHTGDW